MATDSTIYIAPSGGTITFSATSEPSNPTVSIPSPSGSTWVTTSGNIVTISENDEITERTGSFSVNVTTTANTDYNGTATTASAYTVIQESSVVDPAHANVLDIVFESKKNSDVIIVKNEYWSLKKYPKSDWTPIGLVVIPAEHGVLKDGTGTVNQCGIMSLLYASYLFAGTGDNVGSLCHWGGSNVDISGKADGLGRYDSTTDGLKNYNKIAYDSKKNNKTTGLTDADIYACLPMQKDAGKDPEYTGSQFIPSPYSGSDLKSGTYNEDYGTTNFDSERNFNCLADFGGIVNTKILTDLHTGQSDWKTAREIKDSEKEGYYPEACACARYKTKNTKAFVDCSIEELRNGTGFWYMPAIGELGYIAPRYADIENLYRKLRSNYDSDSVFFSSILWVPSSTESGKNKAMVLELAYDSIDSTEKNIIFESAIPFMRL